MQEAPQGGDQVAASLCTVNQVAAITMSMRTKKVERGGGLWMVSVEIASCSSVFNPSSPHLRKVFFAGVLVIGLVTELDVLPKTTPIRREVVKYAAYSCAHGLM